MDLDYKSKIHFILVAGFSADHLETIGLKKSLEKKGFSTDALSFYGEGYIDDFTDLKISDCIENISIVINKRAQKYEKVFGIGICLGGALLLEHAKQSDNLKGIASIGTPFRLINKSWINFGQKFFTPVYFFWKRMQKIKFLRLSPIGAINTLMEYLESELPKNLSSIKTPLLLLHSKKDPVSDYTVLPEYLAFVSSEKKQIAFFENGNHVIDNEPDLVIKDILDFFGISA